MTETNEAAQTPSVQKRDPWPHHPPLERFKTRHGYEESGYETQEQWKAYIRSEVASDAFDIWAQAADLLAKIEEFGEKHSGDDPGAEAIAAAGLPIPEKVKQYGTRVQSVNGDFQGFAWALNEFIQKLDFYCLDPDEWDENGLFIATPKPEAAAA